MSLAQAATLDKPSSVTFVPVDKIKAKPSLPSLDLHTGDISHLSRDPELDAADQVIKGLNAPVFYVSGEHDLLDDRSGKAYLDRYGKGAKGQDGTRSPRTACVSSASST